MAQAQLKRRGHGEDAIYFDAAKNRYVGAISLGYTPDGKYFFAGAQKGSHFRFWDTRTGQPLGHAAGR